MCVVAIKGVSLVMQDCNDHKEQDNDQKAESRQEVLRKSKSLQEIWKQEDLRRIQQSEGC